ncbi:serine carboxypeptidase 1-like [Asparagus officinalis]|uniref:serine carboxypeptidase 1-like n=1 Tax=Asparagus officinalis TaxID=4686 RepID=UPI00098DEC1F|nr:serine carboxypeptidase 1-like [Asparagus officinalis]
MVATFVLFLLMTALLAWEAGGAPVNAEVKQFPDFDGLLPSKHYAGYITVGDQEHKRHLYYYFATSERSPTEDPLTIWINGGPACAGLSGLFQLVGPFKIEHRFVHVKERRKIKRNHFSWTKVSNLLFVDYPAGTGYSYADIPEDYITNDAKSVSDLYEFISKWFREYPEFLPNPLYLAGCSYSGVVVPVLAQDIANGIEAGVLLYLKRNSYGYSLGNAAIDIDIQSNAQVPYAHRMGLISNELYEDLSRSCSGKYWNNSHPDCLRNLEIFEMQTTGINKEHILCLPCHHEMGVSMNIEEYESIRMHQSLHGDNEYSIYCHNYEKYPQTLFDLESTRECLHAMPAEVTGKWKRCSVQVQYERNIWDLTSYHLNLTMKGYRAFFYSGDHDMVLPYTATLKWIRRFNYSEIEKWRPWFVDEHIAGYTVRFDHNIVFATLKGAGHTVWEYLPREALICYQRWIDADSL